MPLDDEELRSIVASYLTREERERGVAYGASEPIPADAVLEFPNVELKVPWEAVLFFVDRQPLANWGHSSRYLLVRRGEEETLSVEARFPPFASKGSLSWRVVHQAPDVPDTSLGVPKA